MRLLRKISLPVLILAICAIKPAYAHYSNEYNFVFDLLRSLHYCQWAFVYEVKDGASPVGFRYDIMSANYKLKQAKANILKYADSNELGIKESAFKMIRGIDSLTERNNRLLRVLDSSGSAAFLKTSEDNLDMNNERNKGIEDISASAKMVFTLISDPDDHRQAGEIKFKISRSQRSRLLKRLDGLFKGLTEWCKFSASLGPGQARGSPAIKKCMIFDLGELRESFLVSTYDEARAKGLSYEILRKNN